MAAPTQSTIIKSKRESSPIIWSKQSSCPRHESHSSDTESKVIKSRKKLLKIWWQETYKLVLKKLLHKKKKNSKSKGGVGGVGGSSSNVRIPRLKLPRHDKRQRKQQPFPLRKAIIDFETPNETLIIDYILNTFDNYQDDDYVIV